jgi:hypothetical protein
MFELHLETRMYPAIYVVYVELFMVKLLYSRFSAYATASLLNRLVWITQLAYSLSIGDRYRLTRPLPAYLSSWLYVL